MAQTSVNEPEPEWVTFREASARLGLSVAWLRIYAKGAGIKTRVGGARPGVYWPSVAQWIERSKIEPNGSEVRQRGPRRK